MPDLSRPRATRGPTESVNRARALAVGDRVRFLNESQARFKVQARDDRYVVLTKPFNARRTVIYTVIDLEEGVRGPDDCYGTGYETPEEIAESLRMLAEGETAVSQRHRVSLVIADVKPADAESRRYIPAPGGEKR